MELVLLKVFLTPLLIGAASLVARRWGPSAGGWLVALPLTSGPVTFYLALEHGSSFASGTAAGSLAGLLGVTAFCLAYGRAARGGPVVALILATLAFVVASVALQPLLGLPVGVLLVAVWLAVVAALRLLPPSVAGGVTAPQGSGDIPARMAIGTLLVLSITAAAAELGPHLTGVVSTFPVYVSVLAVFAHRLEGAPPAVAVVRGTIFGLVGTAVFQALLSEALPALGIGVAFLAAIVASGAVQGAVLAVARRVAPLRVRLQLPIVEN